MAFGPGSQRTAGTITWRLHCSSGHGVLCPGYQATSGRASHGWVNNDLVLSRWEDDSTGLFWVALNVEGFFGDLKKWRLPAKKQRCLMFDYLIDDVLIIPSIPAWSFFFEMTTLQTRCESSGCSVDIRITINSNINIYNIHIISRYISISYIYDIILTSHINSFPNLNLKPISAFHYMSFLKTKRLLGRLDLLLHKCVVNVKNYGERSWTNWRCHTPKALGEMDLLSILVKMGCKIFFGSGWGSRWSTGIGWRCEFRMWKWCVGHLFPDFA